MLAFQQSMSQQQEGVDAGTEPNASRRSSGKEAGGRESCVPHFDALWFCYSELSWTLLLSCRRHAWWMPLLNAHWAELRLYFPFCARTAPGYQLRQFYRYGTVSDCQEYWATFYNCLKKRTAYAHTVRSLNTCLFMYDHCRCSCAWHACMQRM